jgi:hypothetical protein
MPVTISEKNKGWDLTEVKPTLRLEVAEDQKVIFRAY